MPDVGQVSRDYLVFDFPLLCGRQRVFQRFIQRTHLKFTRGNQFQINFDTISEGDFYLWRQLEKVSPGLLNFLDTLGRIVDQHRGRHLGGPFELIIFLRNFVGIKCFPGRADDLSITTISAQIRYDFPSIRIEVVQQQGRVVGSQLLFWREIFQIDCAFRETALVQQSGEAGFFSRRWGVQTGPDRDWRRDERESVNGDVGVVQGN